MMSQRHDIPADFLSLEVFEELKDTFSNSQEFESLVKKFLEVTFTDLQEVKAAFLRGEWKNLAKIAHRMVSSTHPFGANRACSILKDVEKLALSENTQSLREQIKVLDDCLNKTRIFIEQAMQTNLGDFSRTKGRL